MKKPTSIAHGTLDSHFPKAKVEETEAILNAKTEKGKGEHEVVWYEGARHGFAVRRSQTDLVENERGMAAEAQAIAWFTKCFAAAK
ncbi:hypothetical protein K432DRAFT_378682 [Lepidopterella palustris CBS 459.81]|uniref:Dienelactone hydrolase domain-containing protein n=1 Tax=Lepidopterella palustris CBS 459.81 TaxID=1314670 RepID=A0A8E2EI05_9PEZI|nr:hypothetical protein K432DRAFT_378682 [Lepidopterella palustris CBS 459.81]